MSFRTLDERVLVAGQIEPADIVRATAEGVTLIVNNRPDLEEDGQPLAAEIEAAARAAGVDYRHIPIAGGIVPGQAESLAALLDATEGKTLLFCKSGTRSTWLWALAEARRGGKGEAIIARAAAAGYDLTPLRGHLP